MYDHDDIALAYAQFSALTLHDTADALIHTTDRDLIYKGTDGKQVMIPCNPIHAQLKLAENSARATVQSALGKINGNLAVANISFVVSSHPYDPAHKTHNRRLITLPLQAAVDWGRGDRKHWLSAKIQDFWGEDAVRVPTVASTGRVINQNRNPKQLLRQQRANSAAARDGVHRGTHYDDYPFDDHYHSAGKNLEQEFHHSEQAIYEMLQQKIVIQYYITHLLQAYNVQAGDKVYAIILDIYTTRYMCQGCAARSYNTAHYPGRALLAKWSWELEKSGYRTPKVGLRMVVRATGEMPAKDQPVLRQADYKAQAHHWPLNPGRASINSIVMEADARHIPWAAYDPFNDLFRRTVFFSNKAEQEKSVGALQDKAIQHFGEFLVRRKSNTHNRDNVLHAQAQPAGMPVAAILAALNARLPLPGAVQPLGSPALKRQAQDIYLPGQPAALTGVEFRGLYFI